MAYSCAVLFSEVISVLVILCLSKESIQTSRTRPTDNKEYFSSILVNSHDADKRMAALVPKVLLKSNIGLIQRQNLDTDVDEKYFKKSETLRPESRGKALPKRRSKRVIFGEDERRKVPKSHIEKCPYSASVILSTGCSGILISPRHILTSAHCLHNGSHYVDGYRKLRVGFLLQNGTTVWQNVSSTKMPKQWKTGRDWRANKYDYALIKLEKNHGRCWLSIAPSTTFFYNNGCAHRYIHFVGFDEDRRKGSMLYRGCRVSDFDSNMLFHCCDAIEGSSGAGVYEKRWENGVWKRYVIGVNSGNRDVRRKTYPQLPCPSTNPFHVPVFNYFTRTYTVNYNAVLRLKYSDVYHICTWMKRLGGESCKSIIKERKRRRRQSRKRHARSRDRRCENML